MKRSALTVFAVLIITMLALPALSIPGVCSEVGGTKTGSVIDGDLDGVVLPAGTVFCVKAAGDNSGVLTANGTTTLLGYVTWLNVGGQIPNVSHYVVYRISPTTTTTAAPTTTTTGQQPTTTTTIEVQPTTTTLVTTTTGTPPTTTTAPTTTASGEPVTTTTAAPTTTTAMVTVSGPPTAETLPFTGFDPSWLAGAALALGSTGALLVRRSRR